MKTTEENNHVCGCKNGSCDCKGNCKCSRGKESNRDNTIKDVKNMKD